MKIGGAWNKQKDGKEFISIAIDEDITPLIITPDKSINLFTNDKKTEDKHPDYIVCMFKKKDKQDESNITQFM